MATAREDNPYGGGGLGTGGKFRKRPFRRTQTTPYDRPPTAIRNSSSSSGWLSKIVDPAQRLITSSAHRLFSSFLKRLPPPAPSEPSLPEASQDAEDNHQEIAALNSGNRQQGVVGHTEIHNDCSDKGGLTELEQLLKQKTFTRSEIDHLTALLHSRTVDSSTAEVEKRTEVFPSKSGLSHDKKENAVKTLATDNGIESHPISTPYVSSTVLEDVATPAELAKAYMGSRSWKLSPSMLGLRSEAVREDTASLNNQPIPPKSPIMSIVPKISNHVGGPDNGFITPRSRGRSALYHMARTPYSRIHPVSKIRDVEPSIDASGGASSSARTTLDKNLSGSVHGALKRRSSVFDNDIGSVGPIRRIRHKSNLLSSRGLSFPVSGSSLSTGRVGYEEVRKNSSLQKPVLPNEVKHNANISDNLDNSLPRTSYVPLPSQSSEMASKILQHLDKLVSPKEKSPEFKLQTLSGKSPSKLLPSMLHGQALRSLEDVDSSKFLENVEADRLDGSIDKLSPSAQNSTFQQHGKFVNGPPNPVAPSEKSASTVPGFNSTISNNNALTSERIQDSSRKQYVTDSLQTRSAFQMSVPGDFVDMDDDDHSNVAGPSSLFGVKEMMNSTVVEQKGFAKEAVAQEEAPASKGKLSMGPALDEKAHHSTSLEPEVSEKSTLSYSVAAPSPGLTVQPLPAATQSVISTDKTTASEPIAAAPRFSVGNKVGSLMNTSVGFGEKVPASKEQAASAPPLFMFGLNQNSDKAPHTGFSSTSSVIAAFSDPNMSCSSSSSPIMTVSADSKPKNSESNKSDAKKNSDAGFFVGTSEFAPSSFSSVPFPASTTSMFSSCNTVNNSNQSNGPHASNASSSSPSSASNINMVKNPFSSTAFTTSITSASSTSKSTGTVTAFINGNSPALGAANLFPASTQFQFDSSPLTSSSELPVSSTSGSESLEAKTRQNKGSSNLSSSGFGGSSTAVGGTGSGIFGFGSSAASENNQSLGFTDAASSGFVFGGQTSLATTSGTSSSESLPIQVCSSASTSFGLVGSSAFSSASSIFGSSTTTNLFSSGATLCPSTTSSSEANAGSSSSGTASSLFGLSSWQQKSSFPSTFSTSSASSGFPVATTSFRALSPSSGFSFATSTSSTISSSPLSGFSLPASAASTTSNTLPSVFGSSNGASPGSSTFPFTSSAASSATPVFGNPSPVFPFGSASVPNNDQMNMEDSMAEDTIPSSTPPASVFGQQAAPPSNFVFGAAPSVGSPFQFGTQQNPAPQAPSPFQTSGSLEFNAGGSFSLGTGGGDKSGRRILKVSKHKNRRK